MISGVGLIRLASRAALVSGTTTLLRSWRRRRSGPCVFVLEYHDVTGGKEESEGVISANRLRLHLRYLSRHYRLASLQGAIEALSTPGALSEDLVVLTFDDGLAGNYEAAWPVLRDERIPATIFLTTGFLDGSELWFDFARRALTAARRVELPSSVRVSLAQVFRGWPCPHGLEWQIGQLKRQRSHQRNDLLASIQELGLQLGPAARPLTWDQVREMRAGGIEMGGHTVTHPILSTLAPEEQDAEIRGCKDRIADETGVPPATFAMPNGSARDFNVATLRILRKYEFRAACTTIRGSNSPGCDPLLLRRIGVGSDSVAVLAARLSGFYEERFLRWIRPRLPTTGDEFGPRKST